MARWRALMYEHRHAIRVKKFLPAEQWYLHNIYPRICQSLIKIDADRVTLITHDGGDITSQKRNVSFSTQFPNAFQQVRRSNIKDALVVLPLLRSR